MKKDYIDAIHKINYLNTELEALYHKLSLKLGIADSVSMVLYSIYDAGSGCLLSDIYKNSGISKQTVNSAIRSLEADGILYLEQYNGRAKKIILTDKGSEYIKKTAAKVHQAEIEAFATWTDEEVGTYVKLSEKYVECFRQEIEGM